MTRRLHHLIISVITVLALSSCEQHKAPQLAHDSPASVHSPAKSGADKDAFRASLGLGAYTSWSQAIRQAQQLDQQLSVFLHQPDSTHLVKVQSAWREAYNAYLNTLIYAYLPIKDPVDWRQKNIDYRSTLTLLDSWPIEGGYIDHVPGYPFSGIVNDLTLELNEETLLTQHGFSDPSYASLGYHALEFMLWGANGDRNSHDFIARENTAPVVIPSEGNNDEAVTDSTRETLTSTAQPRVQNHNRRRQYLQLLSNQLSEHLHRLQRRWQPSNGYYAELLNQTPAQQTVLASLMACQALLSKELLDRRLGTNSSEFSNTGTDDVIAIHRGLQNLLAGNNEQLGLIHLLPQPLEQQWENQFEQLEQLLTNWQEQGLGSADMNQKVRLEFISLLSLLEKTADALDVRLPRTEDLAGH